MFSGSKYKKLFNNHEGAAKKRKKLWTFETFETFETSVKRISSANPEFETHDNIIKDQLKTKSKELQN